MSRRPTPASRSASASADLASTVQGTTGRGDTDQGSASRGSAGKRNAGQRSASRAGAGQANASGGGVGQGSASGGGVGQGSASRASAGQGSASGGDAGQRSASRGGAGQGSASRGSTGQGTLGRGGGGDERTGPGRRRLGPGPGSLGQVGTGHGIPDATVARLPVYLRALYTLADHGVATVSSEELAAAAGVNSAKLRKDLSHLGSYGTRGVGYDVDYLIYQVSRELGLTQDWPVLIVGAGNLGRALANYGGFASRGFRIAAMVDADPEVVGTVIARHTVRNAADLEDVIERFDVSIGVIATPAAAAQEVCDRLVAAGVSSILNFAPVVLNVPSGVDVRKVDLSIELQILAFHAQRRGAATQQGEHGREGTRAGRRLETVPGGELGLDVPAEIAGSRLNVAAGLAAVQPADYGKPAYPGEDYPTGVQAVGR
jgi:redox-sensing transcriptional repressor